MNLPLTQLPHEKAIENLNNQYRNAPISLGCFLWTRSNVNFQANKDKFVSMCQSLTDANKLPSEIADKLCTQFDIKGRDNYSRLLQLIYAYKQL